MVDRPSDHSRRSGGRYLVTAAGSNINSCGYTLEFDAAMAATWAAAFGG